MDKVGIATSLCQAILCSLVQPNVHVHQPTILPKSPVAAFAKGYKINSAISGNSGTPINFLQGVLFHLSCPSPIAPIGGTDKPVDAFLHNRFLTVNYVYILNVGY